MDCGWWKSLACFNPPSTIHNPQSALFWLLTFALTVAALVRLVYFTPDEATMGPIQKIFYLHLPVAISTFVAFMVGFVASIGFLTKRNLWWDDFASAANRVGVQLCAVVLITGMIWGKSAWGQWWTWSPRLTFSLVLFLLYVVYLIVRSSIESSERRAIIGAVYSIIAFLDVPLVYLSVKLMPDIHPTSIQLAPAMKVTLLMWFAAIVPLAAGLIIWKTKLNTRDRLSIAEKQDEQALAPIGGITC